MFAISSTGTDLVTGSGSHLSDSPSEVTIHRISRQQSRTAQESIILHLGTFGIDCTVSFLEFRLGNIMKPQFLDSSPSRHVSDDHRSVTLIINSCNAEMSFRAPISDPCDSLGRLRLLATFRSQPRRPSIGVVDIEHLDETKVVSLCSLK